MLTNIVLADCCDEAGDRLEGAMTIVTVLGLPVARRVMQMVNFVAVALLAVAIVVLRLPTYWHVVNVVSAAAFGVAQWFASPSVPRLGATVLGLVGLRGAGHAEHAGDEHRRTINWFAVASAPW